MSSKKSLVETDILIGGCRLWIEGGERGGDDERVSQAHAALKTWLNQSLSVFAAVSNKEASSELEVEEQPPA